MADKKKYYIQLARAIPATSNVQDFEAKRVLNAMAEIMRKLLTEDVDSDSSAIGGGDTTDNMLTLIAGDNVTIDELPNNARKISSKDTTGGGGMLYTGRHSVDVSGNIIRLKNDEQSPGNNEVYGTNASGTKGWNPVADVMQVKNSIEMDSDEAQLVGDAASPGNDKVYGTDGSGTKGWQDSGGIDLTGANLGDIIAWKQTTTEWLVHAMSGLATGDFIRWNASTGKWVKLTPVLNSLSDVNFTSPSDGDLLEYDSGTSKWIKRTPTTITVVTDVKYDNSTHRLEKKTRASVKIISTAAESGWTMITNGQFVVES